jgi:hypothetical protein
MSMSQTRPLPFKFTGQNPVCLTSILRVTLPLLSSLNRHYEKNTQFQISWSPKTQLIQTLDTENIITKDVFCTQIFFGDICGGLRERAHQENSQLQHNRNFRELLSGRVEYVELIGTERIEETTTQLAEDWETQLPGNWASHSSPSCAAA